MKDERFFFYRADNGCFFRFEYGEGYSVYAVWTGYRENMWDMSGVAISELAFEIELDKRSGGSR